MSPNLTLKSENADSFYEEVKLAQKHGISILLLYLNLLPYSECFIIFKFIISYFIIFKLYYYILKLYLK